MTVRIDLDVALSNGQVWRYEGVDLSSLVLPRQTVTASTPQPESWYRTVNTLRFDRTDDAREVRELEARGCSVSRLDYTPPYNGRYTR